MILIGQSVQAVLEAKAKKPSRTEIFKQPKTGKKQAEIHYIVKAPKFEGFVAFVTQLALTMVIFPLLLAFIVIAFKVLKIALQLEIK